MSERTFLELSGMIAETMLFPAKDVPLLLRRVRMFDTKGLLNTSREDSGRREGKLNEAEAARLAILMGAFECGVTTAELESVNAALNTFPGTTFETLPASLKAQDGTGIVQDGLHAIVRGTNHPFNENWLVRIRFTRVNGARAVTAMVLCEGWETPDSEITRARDMLDGKKHLGTLMLPASDLIRPFLSSDE